MIQQGLIASLGGNKMTGSLLTNLVAYYKMETLTTDSLGTYGLTNNNSVASGTGKILNAADFGATNTNKYLSSASIPFTSTSAASVSLWVKMNTEIGAGTQTFFDLSDYGTNWSQTRLEYDYNAGTRRLTYMINSGTTRQVNSTVTLGTSNWHHLVLTYSGGTTGTITAYYNGSSVGTATAAISGTTGTTDIMTIGSLETSNYASSLIDEVGIWTKALSAGEVTLLYNGGNAITY